MKRTVSVGTFLAVLLCVSAMSLGAVQQITYVEIDLAVALGGFAEYDSGVGTITWSEGASGFLRFDDGQELSFGEVSISGNFSDVVDIGTDSISLGAGAFSISFGTYRGGTLYVDGVLAANKTYDEQIVPNVGLAGNAIVDVEAYWKDGDERSDDYVAWAANGHSILNSNVLVSGFEDYLNQDYASQNMSLIVQIPEPATLSLLSLGAVALLRRKRK